MKRLVFLLVLMRAISSMAATYYVNSSPGTGVDSAAGSSGAPWRTLTTSISKLSAGDTLNCTGSWSVTTRFTWSTANMTIQGGGGATIDLKPVSTSGTLVFTGSGTVFKGFNILSTAAPTAAVQELIVIAGNHSVVSDCRIHDIAPQSVDDEIIFLVSANSCTFSNLTFYNIADHDIFRAWGIYNKWTSCTFSNLTNPNAGTGGSPHADIIQTWWTGASVWSNVVERCYYVNCAQALWQLHGNSDNVNVDCHTGQEGYWTIRNNIIANCPSWPILTSDQFRYYNNLIYKSGNGTGPTLTITDPAQCATGGKFYNNVFVDCTTQLGPSPAYGHNAFTISSLNFGGTGDFNTTAAACKFVNAAAGNFRLQSGSSLIGKGVNLSSDLSMTMLDADGNGRPSVGAWDVGPYQYATSASSTNPPRIMVQPLSVTVQTNQTATFTITATNSPTTYQWYWKGSAVGANSSSYTTPTTTIADSNSVVYVVVSNSFGGIVSSNVYLYVTNGPPVTYLGLSFLATAGTIGSSMTTNGGYLTYSGDYLAPATAAKATYYFTNSTTGNYQIQAVFTATNNANNSVWIAVDPAGGVLVDPTDIWDMTNLSGTMQTDWVTWRGSNTTTDPQYSPLVISNLTAGVHTMVVAAREPYVALESFSLVLTKASQVPSNLKLVNGILSWSAIVGATYRVEYKTNLSQASWDVLGSVTATNAVGGFMDNSVSWPRCYYRVVGL